MDMQIRIYGDGSSVMFRRYLFTKIVFELY